MASLNSFLRGWASYYRVTHAGRWFAKLQRYTDQKLLRWLCRRRHKHGFGYRKYSDEFLHEELGLIRLRMGVREGASCTAGW